MMEVEQDAGDLARRGPPHLIGEHECCPGSAGLATGTEALDQLAAEALLARKQPAGVRVITIGQSGKCNFTPFHNYFQVSLFPSDCGVNTRI